VRLLSRGIRLRLSKVRRAARRGIDAALDAWRRRAISRTEAASGPEPRVSYGRHIPALHEAAHGGAVKFQSLQSSFPNAPRDFNVLYLGSSTRPRDAETLVRLARRRGAAFVWNQNGVAYPGWHGPGWERTNEPLAELLHAADHVFFQSAFCKRSSDRFLGEREGAWEVLHNPVDTDRFGPGGARDRPLTLLLGGNQYQRYRFESAVRALALVAEERDVRLLVGGRISWHADARAAEREATELLEAVGVADRVELVGAYTQLDAPALYRRADVLLHTKYNDPCPTVVLEAMASGLPVVYSASGGTTELVGDAGVGIPAPEDWLHDHPPEPEPLARAVYEAADRREELGRAGRARAEEQFALSRWIERHRELFDRLRP
jgi:glycosyltransferase involved in cell wall biosynthesis